MPPKYRKRYRSRTSRARQKKKQLLLAGNVLTGLTDTSESGDSESAKSSSDENQVTDMNVAVNDMVIQMTHDDH